MNFQNYKSDTCEPLKEAWKLGELDLFSLVRLEYPGTPMPTKMLKGVNSIGFWDARTPQNWGLDWHRNEGIEITYVETGSFSFSTESKKNIELEAEHLTIMRPWQLHKLGNPNIGAGRLHWLILDVEVRNPHQQWKWPEWIVLSAKDIKELTSILRQNEKVVWQSNAKVRECFHEIAKEITNSYSDRIESKLIILINSLLLNILNIFRKGDVPLDKTLIGSKRTVELFLKELPAYIDKSWTLESMAEYCDLGTTRFIHFCKHITNMTPMQHLNYLRLIAASKMLKDNPNMPIKHVAYDCGYTSSQYFATQFKKHFGVSPGNFKYP